MRITVDEEKCVGAGQCVFLAPEVFDQRDSDGVSFTIDANPQDGDVQDTVTEAATLCPSGAISIEE
ncbi:ferredoxin [Stackebrandtia soli]|uniref:ferredoxin n=1 Tax=Stackebrandtia soli TaxID=1892856 RepID=UPI0039E83F2A